MRTVSSPWDWNVKRFWSGVLVSISLSTSRMTTFQGSLSYLECVVYVDLVQSEYGCGCEGTEFLLRSSVWRCAWLSSSVPHSVSWSNINHVQPGTYIILCIGDNISKHLSSEPLTCATGCGEPTELGIQPVIHTRCLNIWVVSFHPLAFRTQGAECSHSRSSQLFLRSEVNCPKEFSSGRDNEQSSNYSQFVFWFKVVYTREDRKEGAH